MKITAGIGSVDDYIKFVDAGADELYCGYVPLAYMERYGSTDPLNRREVMYYNVQMGSESEMDILADMIKDYGVPVTITLNSPYYSPERYEDIEKIAEGLIDKGFDTFIIADPGLVMYLNQNIKRNFRIHLSGETGEANSFMYDRIMNDHISRIIFQRKTTICDMQKIIKNNDAVEYEAFLLNEMCHFDGGYCNTFHCDELAPVCRLPYIYGNMIGKTDAVTDNENEIDAGYVTGSGGCGLCALWKLEKAGITHLKIVSRGNYSDDTAEDIKSVKKALKFLKNSDTEEIYISNMKKRLFEKDCSHNCYYL